ncbi:MAG: hypothetical protein NZ840_03460 [Anaerolineales bacterium]|nr:hypothetical protein [Anaerolineales bacterium]MDW8161090.1 hypothetical protein [Anaerolineales bacterium]
MKGRLVLLLILPLLLSLWPLQRVWSAVRLKSFTIEWDANSQQVKLRWETATELDNLGFQVRRKASGSPEGFVTVRLCEKASGCTGSEKLDFIFAGGEAIGRSYGDYYDNEVQKGVSYIYQLIAVDTAQREEIAGEKTVFTSNPEIPTGSPTGGLTLSPTASITPTGVPPTSPSRSGGSNVRRTPTPTLSPTPTLRPVLPSPSPLPSVTPQPLPIITEPTPTEAESEFAIPTLPLPDITLIFPNTPTLPFAFSTETPQVGSVSQSAVRFALSRLLALGLVVMAWVVLGGWFLFTLRKIQ